MNARAPTKRPERHVKPPAQPDDPRYSITLPCEMWSGFLGACVLHQSRNAVLQPMFRKVPKAIEVLEQKTNGVDPKQDVTIDGYNSTFAMLANLALIEGAFSIGRELVIKASEAEFKKSN